MVLDAVLAFLRGDEVADLAVVFRLTVDFALVVVAGLEAESRVFRGFSVESASASPRPEPDKAEAATLLN